MTKPSDEPKDSKSPHRADDSDGYAVFASKQFLELPKGRQRAVYQSTLERSYNAVQLLDVSAHVEYSSGSTFNLIGVLPTKLIGADWRSFIYEADLSDFEAAWRQVIAEPKKVVRVQYRICHKSGELIWLEADIVNQLHVSGVAAVVANLRNIDRRKHIESKLRESEAKWRFMAEALPELIFTVAADGKTEYCSPQWEAYTGVPVEQLTKDHRLQNSIMHPDDRAHFWKTWHDSFIKGMAIEHQYRLRRKDGEFRWHMCRIKPMVEHDGVVRLWIGSCTDIDDLQRAMRSRHELEMQTNSLKVRQQELEAVNQSKDEFISLASHQLRTPATGVKQYLGMLLQGFAGTLNSDQLAFLQTAYDSNEHQISIVNDLLRVALVDAGKLQLRLRKTNIVRLVKSVVSVHAGEIANRDQRLVLKVTDSVVSARVDSGQMRTVLDSILDNASKYTPDAKTITVTVTKDVQHHRVSITIADQGVGMTAAEIGKIFNKFSRLENPITKSVDGSGLGLYWAKRIIELHDGSITVRSRPGKGTTFIVYLPV